MSDGLRRTVEEMRGWIVRGVESPAERDAADLRFRARYAELLAGGHPAGSSLAAELRRALLAVAGDDDWPRALAHMDRALRVVQGGWA